MAKRVQSIANWCFEWKADNLSVLGCFWEEVSLVFNLTKPFAICVLLSTPTNSCLSCSHLSLLLSLHSRQAGWVFSSCCWCVVPFPGAEVLQVWLCSTGCQRVAACSEVRLKALCFYTPKAHSAQFCWWVIQSECSLHPRGIRLLVCLVNIPLFLYHSLR